MNTGKMPGLMKPGFKKPRQLHQGPSLKTVAQQMRRGVKPPKPRKPKI
jgi:hypothetical protein